MLCSILRLAMTSLASAAGLVPLDETMDMAGVEQPEGQIIVRAADLSYRPEIFFAPEDHGIAKPALLPDVTWVDLPVDLIRDRWIELDTKFKAAVSTDPDPRTDHLEFQLYFRDVDGNDQTVRWSTGPATADWIPVQWRLRVPENLVAVKLAIRASEDYAGIWGYPIQISDGMTALSQADLVRIRADLLRLAQRRLPGPVTRYAVMCEFGLGGPEDLIAAEHYLREGVLLNEPAAMYFLANFLIQRDRAGRGLDLHREALSLLYLAKQKGFKPAAEQIKPPLAEIPHSRPTNLGQLSPDHAPIAYFQPGPHFSPAFGYLGIGGKVIMELTVGKTGSVVDASIVYSPFPEFAAPALSAARQWLFIPAAQAGKPVEFKVRTNLVFGPEGA